MISEIYRRIQWLAEHKFSDILKSAEMIQGSAGQIRKLRLHLIDNTFLDIWYSLDGSYSFHWEQRGSGIQSIAMITHLMRNGDLFLPFQNTVMMVTSRM